MVRAVTSIPKYLRFCRSLVLFYRLPVNMAGELFVALFLLNYLLIKKLIHIILILRHYSNLLRMN